MEPLLPGERPLAPLLEQAHDLQREALRLSGTSAPPELRVLLRAMNSYYSNKIEGQHTLPIDIERALRNDYSQDADKARRQRLALAHMETEAAIETHWREWSGGHIWSAQMVREIHQDLFARLPEADRTLPEGDVLVPGVLRDRNVSVGVHAAPTSHRHSCDAGPLGFFLWRRAAWRVADRGCRRVASPPGMDPSVSGRQRPRRAPAHAPGVRRAGADKRPVVTPARVRAHPRGLLRAVGRR